MAWGKRAAEEIEELPFWWALFYLPLTAIVILTLVIMPRTLMEKNVEPVPLDQTIQARQINSQLWLTNPNTGVTSPFEYSDNLAEVNKTITQKQMAYGVALDGKTSIYNKPFYDIAKPIAPFSYAPYVEKRSVMINGTQQQLTIEEYYPYRYEIKPQ